MSVEDFPGGSDGKGSAYNAGNPGSIPGLGRSPGEGNGNPLQYFCLENPVGGGACRLQSTGVTKSRTRFSDFTFSLFHGVPILLCLSDGGVREEKELKETVLDVSIILIS